VAKSLAALKTAVTRQRKPAAAPVAAGSFPLEDTFTEM
jgi:hypothetical protein